MIRLGEIEDDYVECHLEKWTEGRLASSTNQEIPLSSFVDFETFWAAAKSAFQDSEHLTRDTAQERYDQFMREHGDEIKREQGP